MVRSRSAPGWALTLGLALSPGAALAAAGRPNIVLIIADDLGREDVGVYGNPSIRTPNIDRLAREGERFERAFLTCSSCSPSRCSIITGRYPHSTGAAELHHPLPPDQVRSEERRVGKECRSRWSPYH